MARNYTPAERALALIGALAGIPRGEVNEALVTSFETTKGVSRTIPPTSFDMLLTRYAKAFDAVPQEVWAAAWEHATSPKSMTDFWSPLAVHERRHAAAVDKRKAEVAAQEAAKRGV